MEIKKLTVAVSLGGRNVDIKVGDGKQTFKWLSGVVASRAKAFKIVQDEYDDGFLVTGIRNSSGDLIDPMDCICEHTEGDCLQVSADLTTTFDSDEWGNPIRNPWLTAAHTRSDLGKKWTDEMNALRERLSKKSMEDELDYDTGGPQSPRLRSNIIQIGEEFSTSDIKTTFALDFKQMTWTWAEELLGMMPSMGETIQSNYSTICNIFLHYCGAGEIGQRYGMTPLEFGHFLHFARVFNYNKENRRTDEIFRRTSRAQSGMVDNPIMTRVHFTQALVCVAMEKELGASIAESLRLLLEGPITEAWQTLSSRYFIYSCTDPLLKTVNSDYLSLLKPVFQSWSTHTPFRLVILLKLHKPHTFPCEMLSFGCFSEGLGWTCKISQSW